MELQSYPSLDTAKLYASWGQDISYMVNYSITPAQYKEITGLDFATEEAAPASESTSTAPAESTSDSAAGSLSESTSTSESVAQ